jgi:hypothetical protein
MSLVVSIFTAGVLVAMLLERALLLSVALASASTLAIVAYAIFGPDQLMDRGLLSIVAAYAGCAPLLLKLAYDDWFDPLR